MSQPFVAHLKKDVGDKIARQIRGCAKLIEYQATRCCVTLISEGQLEIAYVTTNQLQSKRNYGVGPPKSLVKD